MRNTFKRYKAHLEAIERQKALDARAKEEAENRKKWKRKEKRK